MLRIPAEADAGPEVITSGGFLGNRRSLRVTEDGEIFFIGRTDESNGVYRVDRDTGEQFVVSESELFNSVGDLEILESGAILVVDTVQDGIQPLWLVDPASGATTNLLMQDVLADGLLGGGDPSFTRVFMIPPFESDPPFPIQLSMEIDGSAATLFWTGEASRFQLQRSFTLREGEWENLGEASETTEATVDLSDDAVFFRVVAETPDES